MAWLKFHDLTFVVNRERLVAVAVLPGQGCLTNTEHSTQNTERGMVGEEGENYNNTTADT